MSFDYSIWYVQMSIKTRNISLDDKHKINAIRKKYGNTTSSHSFQSLYIWKDDMKLEIYIEEDLFAVKCNLKNDNDWFFPCGSKERIKWFLDQFKDEQIGLLYMRQEDVNLLNEMCPDEYTVSASDDADEYLYSREEQIELKGKKLRTVRNHISRVKRDHELRFESISDENMDAVIRVKDAWVRKSTEQSSLVDVTASELILDHWKELDCMGVLVYVDDEPYAIVAGFAISDDCFDMAMAKQKDTLSGITTYAKYAMYTMLPKQYSIINAEEDLGISGLRTMKEQMGPIGKNLMFVAKAN